MIYNFLLNEVLASQATPSYIFWAVAPWVTDFSLPTPYHVSFTELLDAPAEGLRLFDVLAQMAVNGGSVRILVGSDATYYPALRRLAERSLNT